MRLYLKWLNKFKIKFKKENQSKSNYKNKETVEKCNNETIRNIYEKNNDFLIRIDRSSISMGDDFEEHSKILYADKQMNISEFINTNVNDYLPTIYDKKAMWILRANHSNKWINLSIIPQNSSDLKLLIRDSTLKELYKNEEKHEMVAVYETKRDVSEFYN